MAVERILQISIEIMIEIALLLIKFLKLGVPNDEINAFELLKDHLEGIERYKEMKRFRNVLVHRYEGVDNSIVFYNASKNLGDFFKFISEIKNLLQKKQI